MYRKFGKRCFDLLLSIFALPFVVLAGFIVAPLIWLEDKGPIFYVAPRLGKQGKTFMMYKFRSMKVDAPDIRNADGTTFNSADDSRVTKIGALLRKTSIDELPQLINIINGTMSFVGPRPDLPEHIHEYQGDDFEKLYVLPGITGLNQAYYRNSIPWKERLKVDVIYVREQSLMLDLKIIFKTILTVLKHNNIHSNDTSLMKDKLI